MLFQIGTIGSRFITKGHFSFPPNFFINTHPNLTNGQRDQFLELLHVVVKKEAQGRPYHIATHGSLGLGFCAEITTPVPSSVAPIRHVLCELVSSLDSSAVFKSLAFREADRREKHLESFAYVARAVQQGNALQTGSIPQQDRLMAFLNSTAAELLSHGITSDTAIQSVIEEKLESYFLEHGKRGSTGLLSPRKIGLPPRARF